jgi:hypothetical protein
MTRVDTPNTGGLIVATPAAGDPIHAYSSESDSHVTMLWFGEAENLPDDLIVGVRGAVLEVTGRYGAFEAHVSGVALIGPERASVLLLESEVLVDIRNELCASPDIRSAWMMAEKQFPWWLPHTTTGYDNKLPENPPETIAIDALGLWLAGEKTPYPLSQFDELDDPVTSAGAAIPPVLTLDDLSVGLHFADSHPAARWYVAKRASALGVVDRIPEQWFGGNT